MKYVIIAIRFKSRGMMVLQQGEFPLRGRKPEQIAASWWGKIKMEMFTDGLISVIVDDNEDITEKVKALL